MVYVAWYRERAKEMHDWYFLVQIGMRVNFEAALSRVTVARSRAGGRV